jgi:hypothetical protein
VEEEARADGLSASEAGTPRGGLVQDGDIPNDCGLFRSLERSETSLGAKIKTSVKV